LGTRVAWALEELGVPCECVEPDAKKHEHRSAKYLAVNPHAKGPALVDGDQTFFESDTILLRLGNKYGVEKNLWPAGRGQARVDAISWTAWAMTELGAYLFQDLYHGFGAMLGLKPTSTCGWRAAQALRGAPGVQARPLERIQRAAAPTSTPGVESSSSAWCAASL
jgi:glutathione S-transferase